MEETFSHKETKGTESPKNDMHRDDIVIDNIVNEAIEANFLLNFHLSDDNFTPISSLKEDGVGYDADQEGLNPGEEDKEG